MFDMIVEGIQVFLFLAQGYLLQYFLGSFLQSRYIPGRWNGACAMLAYGILRYGVYGILAPGNGAFWILTRTAFTFLIVLSVAMGFYRVRGNLGIFLLVTFPAVCECSFFLAYMILQAGQGMTDLWVELWDKGCFATTESFQVTVEASLTVLMLLMYVFSVLLSYFFLKRIVKSFREKDYPIHRKELMFLLAPGLVGLLLCVLLRLIMITVEDEVPRLLYDRHPPLVWLVPAILVLALLSILCTVKLFQDMIDLNRLKSGRIVLEKQIDNMQAQVREMERVYAGVRSMKHDMKNALSVVMQLAGKGGVENRELQEYLAQLNISFREMEVAFRTGNGVVDTLLNMKYHEAAQAVPGIEIDAEDLIFPEKLHIQSFDLGVIIGNALDNAIEACRKLKEERREENCFIRISSFQKGKMLFVEVENSFNGRLVKKPHSEFPMTDKADKRTHGMGMMNMKKTAEKYHGAVDWSVAGGVFTLSVMMKNERREENEHQ